MNVSYKPYIEPIETRVGCKYNVTSTSEPTRLIGGYKQNIFKSMEIDDVELSEVVDEYTFNTTGEHTVRYTLVDQTSSSDAFSSCTALTSINIPNGVTSISNTAFFHCFWSCKYNYTS